MAAEKGKLFLLKKEDAITAGTFNTVAGLRSTSFNINGETVDVTTKDSNGWRQLLEGAGNASMSITGAGVFQDSQDLADMRAEAINHSIKNYQIVFESGDAYEGPFQVSTIDQSGEHNGEVTYSVTLESAGEIVFTAV